MSLNYELRTYGIDNEFISIFVSVVVFKNKGIIAVVGKLIPRLIFKLNTVTHNSNHSFTLPGEGDSLVCVSVILYSLKCSRGIRLRVCYLYRDRIHTCAEFVGDYYLIHSRGSEFVGKSIKLDCSTVIVCLEQLPCLAAVGGLI